MSLTAGSLEEGMHGACMRQVHAFSDTAARGEGRKVDTMKPLRKMGEWTWGRREVVGRNWEEWREAKQGIGENKILKNTFELTVTFCAFLVGCI